MTKITKALMVVIALLCFHTTRTQAQALNFGAYSYITIGDILPDNQSYTKEAWIRVYNYHSAHGSNILSAFDFPFWLENGVLSAANNYGATAAATVTDTGGIALNVWVHVAVTYDAASSTMKLYKNGNLIATNTAAPTYHASALQIGAVEFGDFFDGGDIDEVRLWNVARTQSQIQANMNCNVAQSSTLAAYYRFDQGVVGADNTNIVSVYDYSGNAHCGVMTNFPLTGSSSNYIAGAFSTSCYPITIVMTAPASITGSSAVCTGATINLDNSVAGGVWNVDDLDTASIDTAGIVTGNYAGTVNVSYRTCGGVSTKTILVYPTPVVTAVAGLGIITPTVTGGTSPYSYLWSNGSHLSILSGLWTGTYGLTVTDAKGCTASGSYYVTGSAVTLTNSISVTPSNNTYTGGNPNNIYLGYGPQSATLTSNPTGASSFTYSWTPSTYLSSTSSKNPTFTPTVAGHYTYTCTATNSGHSVSATVTLCVVDAVDHSHCGKIKVCHVSHCSHGTSNTESLSSCNVSCQLRKYPADHLGACYGGCGTGARTTATTTTAPVLVWEDLGVNRFPNPFSDAITVQVAGDPTSTVEINIYDLAGRVVEHIANQHPGTDITAGHSLANGMYILEARSAELTKKVKIVKTK